jgi:hypothetical protein
MCLPRWFCRQKKRNDSMSSTLTLPREKKKPIICPCVVPPLLRYLLAWFVVSYLEHIMMCGVCYGVRKGTYTCMYTYISVFVCHLWVKRCFKRTMNMPFTSVSWAELASATGCWAIAPLFVFLATCSSSLFDKRRPSLPVKQMPDEECCMHESQNLWIWRARNEPLL